MSGGNFENRGDGSVARWPLDARGLAGHTERREDGGGGADEPALIAAEFELSALRRAGEVGYARMTVEEVVAGARSNRARFYALFAEKRECYAAGYSDAVELLVEAILARAGGEADWLSGFHAALSELAAFLASDPPLARGVILEARVAGGPVAAIRIKVFERLSRAIDRARRENGSRHSPPPVTADFILNATEATTARYLLAGRAAEFGEAVDDLVALAASLYPGLRERRPSR
jgi:AcrR family transcriptional regulator